LADQGFGDRVGIGHELAAPDGLAELLNSLRPDLGHRLGGLAEFCEESPEV
jgi:hypothetical protein